MTVTEVPTDRLEALDAKIDLLTNQMAVLTADAEYRRRQREAFDDLTGDLAHVSEDAMVMATRELESLSQTADLADTVQLLRRLVEVAPTLDRALVGLGALAEFVDDVAPMGTDMMAMVTDRLADAEREGYFDMLREIAQPEMLAFLRNTVGAVRAEQAAVELESLEPPSLWSLARQVRDPDVRRGMARALQTLRVVSVETGPHALADAESDHQSHNPPIIEGDT
jgi:uncharacterized protein YjgD (DUF1641 family)